jgi:hypothetical protein
VAQLSELLQQSFAAAVEFGSNLLVNTLGNPTFWDGIFKVMKGAFDIQWGAILKMTLSIGNALAAAVDTAMQQVLQKLASTPGVGRLLGIEGFKASSFEENFTSRKNAAQPAQDFLSNLMRGGIDGAAKGLADIKNTPSWEDVQRAIRESAIPSDVGLSAAMKKAGKGKTASPVCALLETLSRAGRGDRAAKN